MLTHPAESINRLIVPWDIACMARTSYTVNYEHGHKETQISMLVVAVNTRAERLECRVGEE